MIYEVVWKSICNLNISRPYGKVELIKAPLYLPKIQWAWHSLLKSLSILGSIKIKKVIMCKTSVQTSTARWRIVPDSEHSLRNRLLTVNPMPSSFSSPDQHTNGIMVHKINVIISKIHTTFRFPIEFQSNPMSFF